MFKLVILSLFFISTTVKSQNPINNNSKDITLLDWRSGDIEEYAGTYSFNHSTNESKLVIIVTKKRINAQLETSVFSTNKKKRIKVYKNLSSVTIENGIFKSDQYEGQFVIYYEKKALKIINPWESDGSTIYELGILDGENKFFFVGRYSNTSLTYLSAKDLHKYSEYELLIMKNEILARYGFIFTVGSKPAYYFSLREWYQPVHSDVSKFLTHIERHNIRLISNMLDKKSDKD